MTFIFDKCHRSSTAVTPVNYECDIQQVTGVLIILKNWEMAEIGLVTPTPWYASHFIYFVDIPCIQSTM